jgi:3-hydroxyacyl-CoA dehydrogenase
VPGFLANRIQAAVVREAIHLAESGVAEIDAIDSVIRDALGLRWAIFGNFETNHTNADGGIREYYTRFGESYRQMMGALDSTVPAFDAAMTERIGRGVDAMVGGASVGKLCRWRDVMVQRITALKQQHPPPRG